jgi:transcriptional regulator with XRE-family HTH domain
MALHSRTRLINRLKDKESRDAFVSSHIDTGLSFQIRALRKKEDNMSQAELAEKLGTSQNAICRLENPGYGKASIRTLKKIASVFDVALIVRFVRFSTLTNEVLNLSTDSIIVDKFDEDQGFRPQDSVTTPAGGEEITVAIDSAITYSQSGVELGEILNQPRLAYDPTFSTNTGNPGQNHLVVN